MPGSFRAGVDIGGTFTDLILIDDATGDLTVGKVLTTPDDPSRAVAEVPSEALVRASAPPEQVQHVIHGTTLIANAVIERKGARTALLTTRGFRDVLELRRHVRVTTYELWADPPEPLVPRFLRIPVSERTGGDGRVTTPVDRAEIEAIAHRLRSEGVESLAIAFLHAYANATNELEAARLLAELVPEIAVTTSSSVLPQI